MSPFHTHCSVSAGGRRGGGEDTISLSGAEDVLAAKGTAGSVEMFIQSRGHINVYRLFKWLIASDSSLNA